jgi:2-hydroxy-3-keto-5-methylthiopentenyl-1-phosphate phosphatase
MSTPGGSTSVGPRVPERGAQALFIIDFDGTVAPVDTVDSLLQRFADPEWKRIEEQWVRGEIDSRECMAAQIALVRGDQAALEQFLHAVDVDPTFVDFVDEVGESAAMAIISDGLDHPIGHVLRRLGIDIPVYANGLAFRPDGLAISFPYADPQCTAGSGVCKCAAARAVDAGRGLWTVLIGDGRSDVCIARKADYVFAKGSLRRCCEAENINHSPFETFGDVLTVVRGWNARRFEADPREHEWPLLAG